MLIDLVNLYTEVSIISKQEREDLKLEKENIILPRTM